MASTLSSLFSAVIGFAVLAGSSWFILSLQQKRWRWFSDRFGVRDLPKARASKLGTPIVFSNVRHREAFATDYTTYLSVRLSVHDSGLSVRIAGPNYYLNSPFLLPFDGLKIEPSKWPDLLYRTVAVSHRDLGNAYLIMAMDEIDWAIENGAPIKVGAEAGSG